jgi:hypothetical protein
MFTISPEGSASWDGWQFGAATTARQFQQPIQTAVSSGSLPRAERYEATSAPSTINPNVSFLLQFKKKEKLRIYFPDSTLAIDDSPRTISGTLVFCDDLPDVLTITLKPAYDRYPQVNLTEITVREHAALNAWVQANFGTPTSSEAVRGYATTTVRYELPWSVVTTDFGTAGERANEPGTSVLRIEYRNPSPDSSLNFAVRYRELSQQYDALLKARRQSPGQSQRSTRQSGRVKMVSALLLLVIALLITVVVRSQPGTEGFVVVQQVIAVIGVALFVWGFVERRGSQ